MFLKKNPLNPPRSSCAPAGGGGKIGARPLPWKIKTNYFLLLFYLMRFFCYFSPYVGLFCFFSFRYGGFFSSIWWPFSKFFLFMGPFFAMWEGLFYFLWRAFLQLAPPPPLQKLLGTSMPFLNFFTMQKIFFLGWGIHFYKPPSPLNMPLPTG